MLYAGMIAIGFVLGVVNAVLFGKHIAAMAVAEVKAVAYDAQRVVADSTGRVKATVSAMEMRLHAKLDALHAKVDAGKAEAFASAGNARNAASGQLQDIAEVVAKEL